MVKTPNSRALEERIDRLIADPANHGHPSQLALEELWSAYRAIIDRLGRITQVSDAYQASARERELSQNERLERQLRQLEKVSRISDRYQNAMRDLNLALKQAATHDSLTGLANRRLLLERLKEEAERSSRNRRPFCVAIIDLDHFKEINDRYGHDMGDQVLVGVARVLEAEVREYDFCGRWGGEEFLVLLPDCELSAAAHSLRRVCDCIRQLRLSSGAEVVAVDASGGVAQAESTESYSQTIHRADSALYEAKRNGRGRIEVAQGMQGRPVG